jgi:hypothetical protein
VKKRLESVCEASLRSYGAASCNDHQTWSGLGVTIGIKAYPRGFMDVYGSIEKDTVAYESGMWVHMHDVWVL